MSTLQGGITVCPFRIMTGIPCPSCGTTEAIIHITKGEILKAIATNPLVIVASIMLLVFPLWVSIDLIQKRNSFLSIYIKIEKTLKIRAIAVIAILIILTIWALNIYRYFKL